MIIYPGFTNYASDPPLFKHDIDRHTYSKKFNIFTFSFIVS